jgi:nucleoside-diphosphate-sugar epimerase
MVVLITGGGGFIGSHLVESQIQKGHRVRVVDLDLERIRHLKNHPRLEMVSGDIADPVLVKEVMAGVEVVYHLASIHLQISVPQARYWAVNVDAVKALLQAAQAARVRRVLHCSSIGVYGVIAALPADEATPTHAVNIYEKTKLAGEVAALQFAQQTGFPVVVVRPGWVYGPRCPRTLKLFRAVQSGRFLLIGAGKTRRQPLYVSDAVAAFELCAQADKAPGQVYLIAGAEEISIKALVRRISEISGVATRFIRLPVFAAEATAFALEVGSSLIGVPPPLSRRSLEFFTRDNAFSIRKVRQELGFEPVVNLEAGLKATAQWFHSLNHRNDGGSNNGS